MKKWFVILILILSFSVSYGQDEKSDKNYSSYSKSSKSKSRSKISKRSRKRREEINYLDSAQYYRNTNVPKALDYIEASLKNSLTNNNKIELSKSYQLLGEIYIDIAKYSDAIVNLEKAIVVSESIKSEMGFEQYFFLGRAHFLNKNYDEALRYFYGYESHANLKNNAVKKMTVALQLGKVYRAQGKSEKAERKLRTVLSLGKTYNQTGHAIYAAANGVLGEILLGKDQDEEALPYLNSAYLSNTLELKSQQKTADNIEEVLIKTNNYDEAISFRQEQRLNSVQENDVKGVEESNIKISEVFAVQNQWENAIPYLNENVALAKERNDIVALAEGYKSLSKAYKGTGNTKAALKNSLLFTEISDSINQQNNFKTAKLIAYNNEISTKQERISSLEKDRDLTQAKIDLLLQNEESRKQEVQFQTTITYILLIVLLLVIVGSVLLYRSSQQKKIANQLLALKSLRSQMNPHFIFNALNSVNSFIAKNDERAANKYLSDFSKLMRQVMENSKYDLVTLQSEMDILGIYIQLEHFRFSDKFDFEFIIDDSIDTEDIEIPPMLVQPYIENAIWHGLRYRETKGFLTIALRAEDNFVEFVITDNGIGRKKSQELKTKNQKETKSTGMKNIETRLNILNEVNKMALKVNVSNLDEVNKSGTIIRIQIPIN